MTVKEKFLVGAVAELEKIVGRWSGKSYFGKPIKERNPSGRICLPFSIENDDIG